MLQDTKKKRKPDCVTTWLDLQNAYGTVPHSLIQFVFSRIVQCYSMFQITSEDWSSINYDESYVRVKTKEWTTDWIRRGIGVL